MDRETIEQVMPDVLKVMEVNIELLTELNSRDLLTRLKMEEIMAEKTNADKVDKLMDHIMKDVKNKFDPLLIALKRAKQHHVVDILTGGYSTTSSECRYTAFSQCIKKLKAAYERISTKFSVFKNHPNLQHYTVNMTNMFTKLRLLDSSDNDSSGIEVTMQEALNCGSKNFVMVGAPGSGKSSCILNAADLWRRTDGMDDPPTGTEQCNPIPAYIKQVIHISPPECKSSLNETVESILGFRCGDESYAVIDHYNHSPEETAVLVDSLDEVAHNEDLVNDIFKTMNNGKRLMVVGCRSNHPLLDKISCNHKLIHVDGFDESHVKMYIEKYFENSGQSGQEIVQRFKKALDKDRKLAMIVRNPLVLSLICILLEAGKYDVDDLHSVKKIDIFNKITELVLEREKITDTSDLELYYKFSFLRLVDGRGFFEEDMKNFGIKEPTSLPFVLINDADLGDTKKGHLMVLPHRSFIEYAGAMYVLSCDQKIQECLLVVLAGKRELNHVLNLLVELMHLDITTTEHISNIILATQAEQLNPWHFSLWCITYANRKIKRKLSKLKVNNILDDISHVIHYKLRDIKPCHGCWKKTKYISTNEGRAVFHNALTCIQSIHNEEERAGIFASALLPLLPHGIDGGNLVRAVPKTDRCVSLKEEDGDVNVFSNRPSDITNSDILNSLPDEKNRTKMKKRAECLQLHTNVHGILYSEEDYISTGNDWKGLFQKLNILCMNTITFIPGNDADILLQELFSNISRCDDKDVKRFMIENWHVMQAVPGTDHWISLIWKHLLDTSASGKILSALTGSNILTTLYETDEEGRFQLYINEQNKQNSPGVNDLKQLFLSLAALPRMDNITNVVVNLDSDCSDLLMATVSTVSGLSNKGVKKLTIKAEKISISAILDFKEQMKQEKWKLSEFDDGWTIHYGKEPAKMEMEIKLIGFKSICLLEGCPLDCSTNPTALSSIVRKMNDGHLVQAVPNTGRCVSLKEADQDINIFSNQPSDITSSGILNSVTDVKRKECLLLHTHMQGTLYSEKKYRSNGNDWRGLLQNLGILLINTIKFNPGEGEDILLQELFSYIRECRIKGVKRFMIENWHVMHQVQGANRWISLTPKHQLKTRESSKIATNLAGSNILTCWYETEEEGNFQLYINEQNKQNSPGVNDLKQLFLSLPVLHKMDNIANMAVNYYSDCSDLLKAMVSTASVLSSKGVKMLTIKTEKVGVSAILEFKKQMVRWKWTLNEFGDGWTMHYGKQPAEMEIKRSGFKSICLLEGCPLDCSKKPTALSALVRKIEDGHLLRAVPKSDRCVSLQVLEQDNISIYGNRPSDITDSDVLSNIIPQSINTLHLNTSQQGVIYSEEQCLPLEEEWNQLFKTLKTHMSHKKIHTVTVNHRWKKESLLLAVRSNIEEMYSLGLMSFITSNGIEDGHLLIAVPKSDRCVSLKVLEQDNISIYGNRPSDITDSDVLSNIIPQSINNLHLHTSQQGVIYSEEKYLPSEEEWDVLFKTLKTHLSHKKIHTVTVNHRWKKESLLLAVCSNIQEMYSLGLKSFISSNGQVNS